MLQGIFSGLIIFGALVFSLTNGVEYYQSQEGRYGPVLFWGIALLVLLADNAFYLIRTYRRNRAKRWPFVMGTIDEVNASGQSWRVYYRYRVKDTPYQNDKFSLVEPEADPASIAVHITHTPNPTPEDLIGRRVRVFYNPNDANTSVICHAIEISPWRLSIPSAVCLSACLLLGFIMFQSWGVF